MLSPCKLDGAISQQIACLQRYVLGSCQHRVCLRVKVVTHTRQVRDLYGAYILRDVVTTVVRGTSGLVRVKR